MAYTATAVSVTSAATTLLAVGTTAERRRSVTIYNNGTATIYVGGTNGVTTATGFPIPVGASFTVDRPANDQLYALPTVSAGLFAIAASGTHDVRVLVEDGS